MADRDTIIRHLRTEISALDSRLDADNNLLLSLREQLRAHETRSGDDRRTQVFRRAANEIFPGEFTREFAHLDPITVKDMGEALIAVSSRLDLKFAEVKALGEITERVNSGVFFDEVLDHVFDNFEKIIPYDRIGVALIEESDKGQTLVRAQWGRAKYESLLIRKGYAAPLEGSSLQKVTECREPLIINNLEIHLDIHPDSMPTQLIVKEGIRSNLTCPLVVQDQVTGFIFFSSLQPYIYMDAHIELFSQIAGELALTLEKSRAYEDLYLRNEFIKKVFGHYVTNEVAEAVLSSDGPLALGGDRRKVTVLMADLRGFTAMSEDLTPEEVVDGLNVYLGTMANVVMKYGGSVDNFIGDAIMAVFGAPITKPNDTARAIACAVEMQNSMGAVNAEIEGRGLKKLLMGIGVSTGDVIAGNIGSETRIKFSVIGSTVNLAARIEGITSGGQIFVSAATFDEIRDIARTAGHLNVKLKGLTQPVPVYEITGIGGDYGVYKSMDGVAPGVDDTLAKPIDMVELARLLGSDAVDILRVTLSVFVETMADTPDELRRLIKSKDAAALRQVADSAKAAAASAAAPRLTKLLQDLENAAAADDWSSIGFLSPKIYQEFTDVETYIRGVHGAPKVPES